MHLTCYFRSAENPPILPKGVVYTFVVLMLVFLVLGVVLAFYAYDRARFVPLMLSIAAILAAFGAALVWICLTLREKIKHMIVK
jgi:hypothetical protein